MAKILKKISEFFKKRALLKKLPPKSMFLSFAVLVAIVILYPSSAQAAVVSIATLAIAAAVAGIVSGVTAWLANIVTIGGIVAMIAALMFHFSGFILTIGTLMFEWGINNNPFGMSLTNPANNQIIEIGWTIMRDFTNMLFILGLAYIGLATALDFGNKFNTARTFWNLLIVALLINFSPVICGVVVDAFNIITNFFLSPVDFTKLGDAYVQAKGQIEMGTLAKIGTHVGEWFGAMLLVFFGIGAGIILGIFGLLFILRNFIIWLLVIISPVAFFAGIFEKIGGLEVKKYHDLWKRQFLSWSFIAVPAGFFLYLSYFFFDYSLKNPFLEVSSSSSGFFEAFFVALSPYLITGLFMYVAFYFTLRINAAGSGIIIGSANKLIKGAVALPGKAGKIVGVAAGAAAGGFAGAAAGGGVASIGKGLGTGWKDAATAGKGIFGRLGGAVKGGAGEWWHKGAGFTKEGRELGAVTAEQGREKLYKIGEKLQMVKPGEYERAKAKRFKYEDARKELDVATDDQLKSWATGPATSPAKMSRKALAIEKQIKDGDFDYENREDPTTGRNEAKELVEYMQKNHKEIKLSGLAKQRLDLAPLLKPEKLKEKTNEFLSTGITDKTIAEEKARDEIIQETIAGIDFTDKAQKNKIQEEGLNELVIANLTTGQIDEMAKELKRSQKRALLKAVTDPSSEAYVKLSDRITELRGRGTAEDNTRADEIDDLMSYIQIDPNFHV